MALNAETLARASSRHPWRTIAAWLVLIVAMGTVTVLSLDGVLNEQIAFTNRPESIRVEDGIAAAFPDVRGSSNSAFFLVDGPPGSVNDPASQAALADLADSIRSLDDVIDGPVYTWFDLRLLALQLIPGNAAAVAIQLKAPEPTLLSEIAAAAEAAAPGAEVRLLDPLTYAALIGQTESPPPGTDIPEAFAVVSIAGSDASDDAVIGSTLAVAAAIRDAFGPELAADPVTPYELTGTAEFLVSEDESTTLIPVTLSRTDADALEELRRIAREATTEGFRVLVGGQPLLDADFSAVADEDLLKGETVGLAIALVVLILVFAALVAAIVPVIMGVFSIVVALGIVALVGQLVEFNLFVENMVTMLGLALGIDYSLFILSRYREERQRGEEVLEAIGLAGATANRAVFFSGLTVILSLVGILFVPTTIFQSLGAGAVIVTFVALAASMTLLPAILALLGDRVNWPVMRRHVGRRERRSERGGFWDRVTERVMARPVLWVVVTVVLLGGLGSQYFQLNRGTSQNVAVLPDEMESKAAYVTLLDEFSGGATQPVQILIRANTSDPEVGTAIADLRARLAALPVLVPESTVRYAPGGKVALVEVAFAGDPVVEAAFQTIRDLRSEILPDVFRGVPGATALVGGQTAFFTDFIAVSDDAQIPVFAFVLGLSFILLTVVFRSIVLPIKAILMNLLSVGATYGVLTIVFQEGIGIDFFNAIGFRFRQMEAIEAWLPILLFSVLFGLSMDYHVFMLTRIREEYGRTADVGKAVAYGLRTTARIITGAALIMVAVFISFASARLGELQQLGLGLAVAVLLDATIVRSILVPASMRLLGDLNWYLPTWLRWLPEIHVEGTAEARERA